MLSFPGVQLVVADRTLLLRHQAVAGRAALEVEVLKKLMAQAGCEAWYVDASALVAAVQRCNAARAESAQQGAPQEGQESLPSDFELPIAERRDAGFELEVAGDAMQAWIIITPPYGGAVLNVYDVMQALADVGVTFGLDEAELLRICAAPQAGRYLIAKGRPTVRGDDVRFELLVNLTRDRTPKVDEHGLVDFRELGELPSVNAGQPLVRRTPATPGVAGCTVKGQALPLEPGRDEAFPADLPGTCFDENDPNLLCAAVKGLPVQAEGQGVRVEQVIQFDGASLATGNISFDGTVCINGDVLQGMKVQATGDIIVKGTVDGGILDAGGSVVVQGGVIARAAVKAGNEVSVRFVENAKLEAGLTIAVDDMALQSQLQAGNQIMVGRKATQRGRLVGGSARAMMRISTPLLGDSASTVTQVLVGVNPVLEADYRHAQEQLEKLQQDEESLHKLVQHLSKQTDKAAMLKRAQTTLEQTRHAMQALTMLKADIDKQMALYGKAKVVVGMGVAGPVDLAFGQMTRSLRRIYGSGSFSVEGRLVLFTPSEGDSSEV